MDTEEDTPRPNDLQDGTMAEVNALRDLLSQIGDPDAAYDSGETLDVSALIDQMRERASQPTQTEQNTANIDYLLMTVGGDQ